MLSQIQFELNRLKCDATIEKESRIEYRNSLFSEQSNLNLLAFVDKGSVELDEESNTIVYNFTINRFVFFTVLMTIITAIATETIFGFLFLQIFIHGSNFAFFYYKQGKFMNRIKQSVEFSSV